MRVFLKMIKQLSSKKVYENKWMKVREDEVEFQNGVKGVYGVVEKPDFALIVPFEKGSFYLVRLYRYPVKGVFWEFPQGAHEEDPDIDPAELAAKELEEETGLAANKIESIGYLCEAYGYSNQGFHIFLAQGLKRGKQKLELGEQDIVVERFTVKQFERMVGEGDIRDVSTVSAYGLLKMQKVV